MDMNITQAQYVVIDGENTSIQATINERVLSVPLDPANKHYRAIQEWVAEGNTIEDAE
jgi:hypothetical protein